MDKAKKRSSVTQAERIEFIKSIAGFESIDPLFDSYGVHKIKRLLHENNLYNSPLSQVNDTAIINLVLKAQGKKPKRMKTDSFRRRKVYLDEI